MKTKKPQHEKKQPPKQGQAKRGEPHELSEASLDKVVGGVGKPRPLSVKKSGVPDDSI